MRAQAHEFSNRMHTVSGLLQLGHYDEAVGFVKATTAADTEFQRALGQRIADPSLPPCCSPRRRWPPSAGSHSA